MTNNTEHEITKLFTCLFFCFNSNVIYDNFMIEIICSNVNRKLYITFKFCLQFLFVIYADLHQLHYKPI